MVLFKSSISFLDHSHGSARAYCTPGLVIILRKILLCYDVGKYTIACTTYQVCSIYCVSCNGKNIFVLLGDKMFSLYLPT